MTLNSAFFQMFGYTFVFLKLLQYPMISLYSELKHLPPTAIKLLLYLHYYVRGFGLRRIGAWGPRSKIGYTFCYSWTPNGI